MDPVSPAADQVRAIAALADPVVRNLRITDCYFRLSAAMNERTGMARANWCTFAVWASRQAGRTIRGEDLLERLHREAADDGGWRGLGRPVRSFWRFLLRRGLFFPDTRLGFLVREINSPFDAFERASDAVARGNLKVFEEIGLEFARYLTLPFDEFLAGLRPGAPPEGQDLLREAFECYHSLPGANAELREQRVLRANLLIGLHEQTRLQPEIRESLEAVPATVRDLGDKATRVLFPKLRLAALLLRPLRALLRPPAQAFRDFLREAVRRAITGSLMVLSLPERTLELAEDLALPFPAAFADPEPPLGALLGRVDPSPQANCGAADWASLDQRMRYISRLFRAFHDNSRLLEAPFTPEQTGALRAGRLPDGRL